MSTEIIEISGKKPTGEREWVPSVNYVTRTYELSAGGIPALLRLAEIVRDPAFYVFESRGICRDVESPFHGKPFCVALYFPADHTPTLEELEKRGECRSLLAWDLGMWGHMRRG